MTRSEWVAIADEIEALWGRSVKWAKIEDSYRYAQTVPAAAARRAVESLYMDGEKNAPAPALVLSKARTFIESTATFDEISRFCQSTGHLWGIVEERDKIRTVVCGRCRTETTKLPHLVPTQTEIEDGVFSGRGDRADEINERIAP